MTRQAAYIVVDIGKTLSKVTGWTASGQMVDRQVRANSPLERDGVRHLDAENIGSWVTGALSRFADHPIEAIVPVAHGAGFAPLGKQGLLFPPLDYEQTIPETVMAAYHTERDPFAETGSPALPNGLNLGAQFFWASHIHPEEMAEAQLVPWAQYWAWFLSGVATCEVTSLGCHTDLWCPDVSDFSPLAKRQGWAERFAPMAFGGNTIGTLRPELAAQTGLPGSTRILAGLHDSNAALLAARGFPEIAERESTVLSTGTWFIAMRSPAEHVDLALLPEARDCLVNVDVNGRPVPSARFMGGREIESLIEIDTRRVDIRLDQPKLIAAVPAVLASEAIILPTLAPGCGPFPSGSFTFLNRPDDWHQRRAAACLYAALVADTSLALIGSRECILVEGRFAEAEVFVRALAALRPDCHVYTANAHNDVSFGALRLIDPKLKPQGRLLRVEPLDHDLRPYRERWIALTRDQT